MTKKIIGTVRVPLAKLLCMSSEWRRAFSYPEPSRNDWKGISELCDMLPPLLRGKSAGDSLAQREQILSTSHCLKIVRSVSFYQFLNDRMIDEARRYSDAGIRCLLLDFSIEEWFDDDSTYWFVRSLAESFRDACNDEFEIGLKADENEWAADVASRLGYDFVVCSDSSGYLNATRVRNRLIDGTELKKPRLFFHLFCYNKFDRNELVRVNPEGCHVIADDEDNVDEMGKVIAEIKSVVSIDIPVIGSYSEEIQRGEMHSDMTSWGARDYILIDTEVRKNKMVEEVVDSEKLVSICEEIAKLQE